MSQSGQLSGVSTVCDLWTQLSCGFAFVYFEMTDDPKEAMERAYGIGMHSRRILMWDVSGVFHI